MEYHFAPEPFGCEVEALPDVFPFVASEPLAHSDSLAFPENSRHYWLKDWTDALVSDADQYMQFSVAPRCGYQLSINDLRFELYSGVDVFGQLKGPRYWELEVVLDGPDAPVSFWGGLWEAVGFSRGASSRGERRLQIIYNQDMCNCKDFYEVCVCFPTMMESSVDLSSLSSLQHILPGQRMLFRFHGYGSKGGKGGLQGKAIDLKGAMTPLDDCPLLKNTPSAGGTNTVAYLVDGTWGHEEGGYNFQSPSNIARLWEAMNGVDLAKVVYFRGIGNEKDYHGDLNSLKDYLTTGNYHQLGRGATGLGANILAEKIYETIVLNYNAGYTGIILAGWSRGAAIIMQVANLLYHKDIPVQHWMGGSFVGTRANCILIEQVHLLDMVHSIGLPNADLMPGWYDDVLPPNIRRAWHYLADTEHTPAGFRQTRPLNAIELSPCKDVMEVPAHGDIGGSEASLCSELVFELMKINLNSLGQDYTQADPYHLVKKSIHTSLGECVQGCHP